MKKYFVIDPRKPKSFVRNHLRNESRRGVSSPAWALALVARRALQTGQPPGSERPELPLDGLLCCVLCGVLGSVLRPAVFFDCGAINERVFEMLPLVGTPKSQNVRSAHKQRISAKAASNRYYVPDPAKDP